MTGLRPPSLSRRRRFRAVSILFLSGAVALSQSQPPDAASREEELEAIRGEIAELTSRLEVVKQSAVGIEGDLERLEVELDLQEKRVAEAHAAKAIASAAGFMRASRQTGNLYR